MEYLKYLVVQKCINALKVDSNEAIFLSYMTIYDGLMVSRT